MATEIIEVIDSAVKIGLGVLISGLSNYFVTKSNNKNSELKESKSIKRQLLTEISEKADKFFEYTYLYFSTLDGIRSALEDDHEITDPDWTRARQKIADRESELKEALSNLYSAQSKLELLGLNDVRAELQSYQTGLKSLRSFTDIGFHNHPNTVFQKAWCEKYLPHKENFRKLLSENYLSLL